MVPHRLSTRLLSSLTALALVLAAAVSVAAAQGATPIATPAPGVTVIASGLTNPRGFTWGDDGTLYLALAGTGGTEQLVIQATPLPLYPGQSGSIVSVADGCTTPIVDGLPSLLLADAGWVFGVTDVATLDGELYVLTAGSTDPNSPNGIYKVTTDGTVALVADLASWFADHPPTLVAPDYEPSGNPFDLEAGTDRLWVTEAVGGRLVTVTPDGTITLAADLSEGHMVPDGLALDGKGGAYVGFETTPPYPTGASKVVHVAADGTVTDAWTGLTALTDVVMGPDGALYAAEMATNNLGQAPFLRPNSGRIVRQTGPDALEEVVTDVPYPAFFAFDPTGALYLDYPGFGTIENRGENVGVLVSIDISSGTPVSLAGMDTPAPTCPGATPGPSPVATPMG
jgi:sugar lactone lactonase YvrE